MEQGYTYPYTREDMLTNANNTGVAKLETRLKKDGVTKRDPLTYRNGTREKTCQNRLSNANKCLDLLRFQHGQK